MFIQRKTLWKPSLDFDLTYWNDQDACWVDTREEATGYHSKRSDRELIQMLAASNPGDAVTLEK
jgi:hypothetical protein